MKRGTPDHWKMKHLARLLKVPSMYSIAWANGVMERLWHYTAKYCPQGDIGRVPDEEIAEVCGWPAASSTKLVDALVTSRWLDRSSAHRLIIHDWHEHCDESVKKTLKNRGLPFFFPESSIPIRENSGLPCLALALPEPSRAVPDARAPVPIPFPQRGDDFFEKIYSRHPKKKDRGLAQTNLSQSAAEPDFDPAQFDRVHELWCFEWAKEKPAFAPTLAQWILDQGWRYPPAESLAIAGPGPPHMSARDKALRDELMRD